MLEIFLYEVAMLVHCPICDAGDIAGDEVEACWTPDGDRQLTFPHDDRIEHARALLEKASALVERL